MNNCRDCTFNFKNICTNDKCEHFGTDFITDFVYINDCSGFQEMPEGMRPKINVLSGDDEEWFA